MHINVRQGGGCGLLRRQGRSIPGGGKALGEASNEALRREGRSLELEAAL
jgi:hypothetical protein